MKKDELKDIIWLHTAFIGDLVLCSGAIALAAEAFPKARQILISTATGCEVLKGSPHLAERLSFSKKKFLGTAMQDLRTQLEQKGVQAQHAVLLQVHRSARSSLVARYLGLRTITYRESVLSFLAHTRVPRPIAAHESVRVASLLAPLGVEPSRIYAVKPQLQALPFRTDSEWQKELAGFQGTLIALAVGSQWGTKRWPLEHYTELAVRFLRMPKTGLVLLGSAEEKKLTDVLEAHLHTQGLRCWNLSGQSSFEDLRAVFPKVSLLVSNDSAPVHFASAFNIPTLALFGPTDPSFGFGPLSTRHAAMMHPNLDCRPCHIHGPQTCPRQHFRCMRELSVHSVFEEAMRLLR